VFELDLPIQLWLYVIEDTLGGNNPEGSLKGLLDRLLSWFGTTLNHRKNLIAHPITPTDPGFIVGYKNCCSRCYNFACQNNSHLPPTAKNDNTLKSHDNEPDPHPLSSASPTCALFFLEEDLGQISTNWPTHVAAAASSMLSMQAM
jgi:hypothetical protein